ncbi:hypothetical protein EYR40_010088 [Pleurotus pulmonarius]|nr:hypothetical protein EYR36_010519 [Pleurotus pulmonarius]KAF4588536.1 hypothetical protein EYR40_010088 [Pleurotus pulmonarius]
MQPANRAMDSGSTQQAYPHSRFHPGCNVTPIPNRNHHPKTATTRKPPPTARLAHLVPVWAGMRETAGGWRLRASSALPPAAPTPPSETQTTARTCVSVTPRLHAPERGALLPMLRGSGFAVRRSGSALAKSERCQSARDFPIVTGSRPGLRTRDPSLSGEP